MGNGLRVAGLLALAACGWMGADGLRRAGAGEPFARVHLPWDANRLPEGASDGRVLLLRPVSPFARFRDALSRADGPDGEAFLTAARGVLRWARNQPGLLLDLGRVALDRAQRRGEPATREVGDALLVEYTARTTHAEDEGVEVWLGFAGPSDDPRPVFERVPRGLWPTVGSVLAGRRPEAAWPFLEPAAADGTLDPRHAPAVTALARARRDPRDLPLLRTLAARSDLDPAAADALRALVADLERPR